MLEIEKSKRQRLEIKTDIDWINEQIEDEKLLKDIKIGVLGLGKLGKHIAKAFKVKELSLYKYTYIEKLKYIGYEILNDDTF